MLATSQKEKKICFPNKLSSCYTLSQTDSDFRTYKNFLVNCYEKDLITYTDSLEKTMQCLPTYLHLMCLHFDLGNRREAERYFIVADQKGLFSRNVRIQPNNDQIDLHSLYVKTAGTTTYGGHSRSVTIIALDLLFKDLQSGTYDTTKHPIEIVCGKGEGATRSRIEENINGYPLHFSDETKFWDGINKGELVVYDNTYYLLFDKSNETWTLWEYDGKRKPVVSKLNYLKENWKSLPEFISFKQELKIKECITLERDRLGVYRQFQGYILTPSKKEHDKGSMFLKKKFSS